MNIEGLGLPREDYTYLCDFGRFSERGAARIREFLQERGFKRIVVFGKGRTGKAVRRFLESKCVGGVDSDSLDDILGMALDAVVVATSPVHYPVVSSMLAERFAESRFSLVELFADSQDPVIGLICESQPRSGTHYTINNLRTCLGWGYASVFDDVPSSACHRSSDGRIRYAPGGPGGGNGHYVVKTHFTRPLHYPEYRYAKTLFLIGYPFDAYYSWARLLSGYGPGAGYRLVNGSKEWIILKAHIPTNVKWLTYVRNRFFVRYEDYYLDFENVLERIAVFLGFPASALGEFANPRKNLDRCYWSDDYNRRFDATVLSVLAKAFYPQIEYHWPEKAALVAKAAPI